MKYLSAPFVVAPDPARIERLVDARPRSTHATKLLLFGPGQ